MSKLLLRNKALLSLRRFVTLVAFAAFSSTAQAQTGPMLTPSAFIHAPGHVSLDIFGATIGKEPNYLSYAEKGVLQLRTRIDGPVFRLSYVPSERAEFTAEFNAQTYAIQDPRYNKTISDFGDATLRAKLGLKRGEVGVSPAVAFQFEVTLPNTSFGNGLGPNTLRMDSGLLVGYKTEKLSLSGKAGISIQDEPLRAHEQRDFISMSGSLAYKVTDNIEAFGDVGGYLGDGVPGAIAKREARAGIQYHRTLFGKETDLYIAGRRGLVDFQGKWGVIVGLTMTLRPGVNP
jgi:Putative MetA-pathway of phenol degradation